MRFMVLVENRPGVEDAIGHLHPAHLDYIAAHPAVLIAGSLAAGDPAPPANGMWIVDAPDREAVAALMEAEPYFVNGLRAAIRIYEYNPPAMFDQLFDRA